MANQHIVIVPGASPLSQRTLTLIETVFNMVDQSRRVKAVYDQVASGGDFAALAEKLGTTTAEAEQVYNLVTSFNTALNNAVVTNLAHRLG